MTRVPDTGTVAFIRCGAVLGLPWLALACLSACSTGRHQAYPGPALPKSQIATLITAPQTVPPQPARGFYWPFTGTLLRILELDGKRGPTRATKDNTVEIGLLPGPHQLKVILEGEDWQPNRGWRVRASAKLPAVLQFDAQAGHTYALRADLQGFLWSARIVDLSDNFRNVAQPARAAQ